MAHVTPEEEAALNEVMQILEAAPGSSSSAVVPLDNIIPAQREKLEVLATQPLFILQKKAMTSSKFHAHSSPIFKHLNIVKLPDLVFLNITVFMHKFHNKRLPFVFYTFFTHVNKRHNYTRSVSNMFYTLPKEQIMEYST